MKGQSAALQILEEIKMLKLAQYLVEKLLPEDYELNMERLDVITGKIQKLRKVYYYTLKVGMNEIETNLENALNDLKNYNDGINRDVTDLAQINQMLKLVAQVIFVAFGLG
jgi:hypothetical protein